MSNEETTTPELLHVAVDPAAPRSDTTVAAVVDTTKQDNKFADLKSDNLEGWSEYAEPEDGEIIMLRSTAASKRGAFRDLKCMIHEPMIGQAAKWYRGDGSGGSPLKSEGVVMTVADALAKTSPYQSYLFYIQVRPPDPSKPRRKCNIASFLGREVHDMIKLKPNNSTFRARVMAITEEMPSAELDTYEKIKDWVEFNFPKPKAEKPKAEKLDLRVCGKILETGTCRYSRVIRHLGNMVISEKEVADILNCNDNFDDAMNALHDLVENNMRDVDIEYEDIDTDHRVSGDIVFEDTDYSSDCLRNFLVKIAKKMMNDDELEDYGFEV